MQTGRPSKRPRPAFGARLHALREEAGLSQAQVAEKLGISQRAYAFWEREPVALRVEQLTVLANILNAPVEALIGQQPKQRGGGPVGKARRVFETVSNSPAANNRRFSKSSKPWWRNIPKPPDFFHFPLDGCSGLWHGSTIGAVEWLGSKSCDASERRVNLGRPSQFSASALVAFSPDGVFLTVGFRPGARVRLGPGPHSISVLYARAF